MNGNQFTLERREFLQFGLSAGLFFFAGCTPRRDIPLLTGAPEALSKRAIRSLPEPWKYRSFQSSNSQTPFKDALEDGTDLVVINDGWLPELPEELIKPIDNKEFFERFDQKTMNFLGSLDQSFRGCVLPVSVSPWVMLFRNGDTWIDEAKKSWQALLDPRLKGLVVLPKSPRLVMELADTMETDRSLQQLKDQALVFDDRYGLNWVLEGKARVVVLPLQRCLSALRRDPRLSIAFPRSGSPLQWTLLVHSAFSSVPFPHSWVIRLFEPPLLGQLLSEGWIPSVTFSEWEKDLSQMPSRYRKIIFPNEEAWSNSWSLPPLTISQKKELSRRWSQLFP